MMDKKDAASSVSVVGYEDTRSTYSVESPPPAYRKPDAPIVKVVRICAVTLIVVTLMIGGIILGATYINAHYSCVPTKERLQQESNTMPFRNSRFIDMDKVVLEKIDSLLPAALEATTQTQTDDDSSENNEPDIVFVQEPPRPPPPPPMMAAPSESERKERKLRKPNGYFNANSLLSNAIDDSNESGNNMEFPLTIDLDELAGHLMEKNQRARLNCFIEKKKTDEVVTQTPKHLRTPFGNLTTDPKFTHITGETMSLNCRSGNDRLSRRLNEQQGPFNHNGMQQPANALFAPSANRADMNTNAFSNLLFPEAAAAILLAGPENPIIPPFLNMGPMMPARGSNDQSQGNQHQHHGQGNFHPEGRHQQQMAEHRAIHNDQQPKASSPLHFPAPAFLPNFQQASFRSMQEQQNNQFPAAALPPMFTSGHQGAIGEQLDLASSNHHQSPVPLNFQQVSSMESQSSFNLQPQMNQQSHVIPPGLFQPQPIPIHGDALIHSRSKRMAASCSCSCK